MKKTVKVALLLWVILLGVANQTQAQTSSKLRGTILDERTKQPLIGVTIRVKGTATGTVSDIDGKFEVTTKQELPVSLIVSFLGYKTQEIEFYETEPVDVFLTEDANLVNAVVVIGYGTQKREELTGSISSIPVAAIKESGSTSFVIGLQGLATGVQVTQSSGSPGGSVSVRIRGGNSITGGNEPLYVIDGFPVYNDNNAASAGAISGPSINALSSINPADIESIDILKDASATAIYGSRGANGVIIVTTKKGKAGKGTVTYDGWYGVQSVSKKIDLLNAQEWGIYKNDAYANSSKSPYYSDSEIAALANTSTDWQDEAFRSAAVQSHQLGFNGGNESTKYSISLGYFDQDGIIINTDYKRITGRVNLTSKVNERLNVGLNLNGSVSTSNVIPSGTILSLLTIPPTVSVYDADGNYTFKSPYESAVANPIATLNETTNETKINRLLANTYGEYQIIPGLKAKILLGADILDNKQNYYSPSTLFESNAVNGSASVGSKFTNNWLNENTLTYTKSFDKIHNIDVLAGYTQQHSKTEGVIANAANFTNNIVEYNDLGSGSTLQKPSSSYSNWDLASYLGRVNYNYLQKYFATVSLRADGSSRLGENNQWGYFPSASVAWQISKESFLSDLKGTISNLKLRLSAGQTGNQEIDPYQSLSLLTSYSYPNGSNTTITGYAPSRIANPDLKWETTTQYDAGIDLGLYEERIKLVVDAYYKKTDDLLLSVPVPVTSGYATSLQNIGSVENKGFEIGLNTENIKGKFRWTTDLTYSQNRNKVLSLSSGVDKILVSSEIATGSVIKVGQPLGSFWGYKTDGLIRSADQIPSTPLLANTKVGDVNYVDLNNDDKITAANDQTLIGNAQPKFVAGFTNNFSYANFDLSVFFTATYGNKIYSYVIQQLMVPTGYQNVIGGFADHYTAENTDAKYQRPNENITTNAVSDLYVFDGSFIRLKSITLGYTLPKSVAAKLKVDNVRFYVTGQNLITWSDYPGYDPEVNSYDQVSSRQGVDTGAYPSAKSVAGGLSITF